MKFFLIVLLVFGVALIGFVVLNIMEIFEYFDRLTRFFSPFVDLLALDGVVFGGWYFAVQSQGVVFV